MLKPMPGELSNDEFRRYSRQLILPEIGKTGQEKLKNSRVLVIGAGGLGCPVLQYLAAAGVGTLGIIDSDKVDISNLHRQILFSEKDTGKFKAEAASERISAINSFIKVITFNERLTEKNAEKIIEEFDVVVDGCDNFETKYLSNDVCVKHNKPLVYGAISQFEGQVSVFNYKGGPDYRSLFPEVPGEGEFPDCEIAGVLGILPGITGTIMAAETLKIILEIGETLSGKLLVFDSKKMQFNEFDFGRSAAAANREDRKPASKANASVPTLTDKELEISNDELQKMKSGSELLLIDVREHHEHESFNVGGMCIPVSQLEENLLQLRIAGKVVLYCKSGIRSLKAARVLREKHKLENVFSLRNGIIDF